MSRNTYAGRCYQCGNQVDPGTGHFERYKGGWRVKHANVAGRGRVTCEAVAVKINQQNLSETIRSFSQ